MAPELSPTPACYRIGDVVIDAGSRRVMRDGEDLKIGGLTFDLLHTLAVCSPSLASYETLAETVWQGRPVTPETIAQRASMLREALADDAKAPRYFEPVRGQGYRLCAAAVPITPAQAVNSKRKGFAIAAGGLAAVALSVIVVARLLGGIAQPSVAVLPFADMSANGDQAYLADGVAEELINTLSELDGLDVASRTSSFAFRETTDDARLIGKELGVTAILEGSVRKSESDLRITVQLIDVDTGFHLWSDNFDSGEPEDIFAIQDQIAAEVAGALGVRLGVGGVNAFMGAGTHDFEAYEAYLRDDFAEAIRIDPNYAAAWAREGVNIASTMWVNPPEDAPAIIENAYEHVARAIELDPESSQAYGEFATLIYATMDWDEAQKNFDEALTRRRDDRNLSNYSNMLLRAGRTEEAAAIRNEIVLPELPYGRGPSWIQIDITRGNYAAARETNRLMDDPIRSTQNRMVLALHDGSLEDLHAAIDAMARTSATYAEAYGPLLDVLDSPEDSLAWLRVLFDDADNVWADKYHDIALLAAYFGDPEFAFEVFSKEIYNTTIRFFALWYPVMSDVRKLPEFRQFARDVNLLDYWRDYGWADYCRPISLEEFVCE